MKPIIVGETNPFGGDEFFALYPEPDGCTGDRLCRMVMGLRRATYMEAFERANLLRGPRWSAPRARERATALCEPKRAVYVLLGRKVSDAFCLYQVDIPTRIARQGVNAIVLPHPSGRNRMWNDTAMVERCRALLRSALPDIPFGELAP